MPPTPSVFLDTSALFAGIWSSGGGGRLLLRLGEADAIRLVVSAQVLVELERSVRGKAPEQLPNLAVLLEQSGVDIAEAPSKPLVDRSVHLTGHANDALVLAAAWSAGCEYFVTLDKRHFLNNQSLRASTPFPVGTPGDCLVWIREILSSHR